jgi:N-acetylmuramoyl-L-alanine amidase
MKKITHHIGIAFALLITAGLWLAPAKGVHAAEAVEAMNAVLMQQTDPAAQISVVQAVSAYQNVVAMDEDKSSAYFADATAQAAKAYNETRAGGGSEEMAQVMANRAVLNYVQMGAAATEDKSDDHEAAQLVNANEKELQDLKARAADEAAKAAAEAAAAAEKAAHEEQLAKGAIHEAYSATAEERRLLAAIIYCEAGNQPENGRVAVGNVVLNRVRSRKFPGSIREVVYQRGQFEPAMSGWLGRVLSKNTIPANCYDAADQALAGATPVGNAIFFMRRELHSQGLIIKDHCFWGSM